MYSDGAAAYDVLPDLPGVPRHLQRAVQQLLHGPQGAAGTARHHAHQHDAHRGQRVCGGGRGGGAVRGAGGDPPPEEAQGLRGPAEGGRRDGQDSPGAHREPGPRDPALLLAHRPPPTFPDLGLPHVRFIAASTRDLGETVALFSHKEDARRTERCGRKLFTTAVSISAGVRCDASLYETHVWAPALRYSECVQTAVSGRGVRVCACLSFV